jgi:dsRNA-specific ribonuclease
MHTFLQMYCHTQDRKLRYDEEKYDTSLGLLWKMTVSVDGIELGEGTRATRKVAKNVAAWEAAKKLGLTVRVSYRV